MNAKSLVDAISFGLDLHLEALGQAMAKALHVDRWANYWAQNSILPTRNLTTVLFCSFRWQGRRSNKL